MSGSATPEGEFSSQPTAMQGGLTAARQREVEKGERIDALLVHVAELTAQAQALVLQLSKDSSASSKPPSSDEPGKRPRGGSSRNASGRRPGKQPGDTGTTLRQVDDPKERSTVPAPAACTGRSASLAVIPVREVRRRQVFGVPEPTAVEATEYAAHVKRCPGCGARQVEPPSGASAATTPSSASSPPGRGFHALPRHDSSVIS